MKLYSGPVSLFTAKVRIALAEKGLAYERTEVGWSITDRYLPHHPEVVALNPKAEVPILVDGDVTLYDSTVILEYLEDRYPNPPLYPSHPAGKGRCRQLEAAADEVIFPFVWDLTEESLYPAGPAGRDGARLDHARAELARHHAELDKLLADCEYLCGDFTVADIGTFIMLGAAATLGAPPDGQHANLQAWLVRVGQRPSVAKEMGEMQAALAAVRERP